MAYKIKLVHKEFYKLLIVLLGAIPGAVIRWQLNNNFFVNLTGAALLGFVIGLQLNRRWKLMLGVGFCGSLTTFSGWIFDSTLLLLNGSLIQAFGLILYTLGFGLLSGAFGFLVGRNIKLPRLFL
ncbi:fluoride efflux transporter FluC [Prochlorococcus sp. MIT 1307]|uniref:fluoride efflux transporter FluC n=1 Tax=Prochlorococcus sp. MIT 1307 TaxID=3096219 RepID=UPI002A763483|nr:CrcB family protein [Prochlorococcus sp. MIT 1307]